MSLTPPEPTPACPRCASHDGVRRLVDDRSEDSHRCGPCGRNFTPERPPPDPAPNPPTEAPGPNNRIVPYLRRHGPAPKAALPTDRVRHTVRERWGIRRAYLRASIPHERAVYYLPEHEPRAIVEAYIDANPRILQKPAHTVSKWLGGHDRALADAFREMVAEARGGWH